MAEGNRLDRMAERLGARVERRTAALVRRLTEPAPPFRVPLSEEDQVRRYLDLRESGGLLALRESHGGAQRDEDVDRYVASMEHKLARLAPHMLLRQYQDPPDLSSDPMGLPPGLLAALGRDGQKPPMVEPAQAAYDQDMERVGGAQPEQDLDSGSN